MCWALAAPNRVRSSYHGRSASAIPCPYWEWRRRKTMAVARQADCAKRNGWGDIPQGLQLQTCRIVIWHDR